jgi:hypothetical protein
VWKRYPPPPPAQVVPGVMAVLPSRELMLADARRCELGRGR